MKHLNHLVTVFVLLFTAARGFAGDPTIHVATDQPNAMYRVNQPIVFNIAVLQDGNNVEGAAINWVRNGDDGLKQEGRITTKDQPVEISTSMDKPGFVRLTLTLLDDAGSPRKNSQQKSIVFDGGAGVAPHELTTAPEPNDFDEFWFQQKQSLAAVPMKSQLTPVPVNNEALLAFDVKIDCAGGKPVSGYLVKPKNAVPRSLPATVSFHGYGVRSAGISGKPNMITLDVNAHGIENGQPAAYYKQLSDGELKGYGFSDNEAPHTSYFLGMYLRVIRAMEFIKSQPEWDGRTLIVSGGSQGGLQALAAAGLDPQVTLCIASKAWCCDLEGIGFGRQRGWRPDPAPGLRYFDAANHAKRIKARVLVDAGLGDYTCPPSSIAAMFNNIPSSGKQLVYIQGATHGSNPVGSRTCWSLYESVLRELTERE